MKILHGTASKVCLALGKKALWPFLFFSFSPNKQKTEHQSELNSVTSWTPNLWKVSLCCAISLCQLVSKLLA
jgi:hypothetical protein